MVYKTENFRPHSPFSEKSIEAISGSGGGNAATQCNLDRKDFSFIWSDQDSDNTDQAWWGYFE